MSNFWLNVRFGMWHVQSGPDGWLRICQNEFHRGLPHGWFEAYHVFWWRNPSPRTGGRT